MTQQTTQLQVLVLGHPEWSDDVPRWLGETATLHHVDTVEQALESLQTGSFDTILVRATDFASFQGLHVTRQAAAIIDSVSQAIGIVGKSGVLDWANPKLLSLPDDVRDRICTHALETFSWAQDQSQTGSPDLRGRRFTFTVASGQSFAMMATPVTDLHNRVTEVAAVVWDTANTSGLQEKIDAIDEAGRELLSLDSAQFARLDAQERLALLEQKILRCTRDVLHFDNFEIRVLEKDSGRLELALCAGMPAEAGQIELYASTKDNGICGYVAARQRSYICPDAQADKRYLRGIEGALSSLTVPLVFQGKVVGVANYENAKLAAFTEDDRQFAEIFARYVVLALHLLELLATERHTTTGRVGDDVLSGITAPVNDILTDIETLVEDYIGHDDLRHRLRTVSENAVKIRETVKELTSPQIGLVGIPSRRTKKRDPVLAGKRVLVADDEAMLRDTVRDVLTGYGCRVCTAEDGSVAIGRLADQAFDLVISDIRMPLKSGYEVFAAAKEANPNTPVILTTGFGYDPNHSIIRARREGLAAVLFKPFKVDQLLNEIRNALDPAS